MQKRHHPCNRTLRTAIRLLFAVVLMCGSTQARAAVPHDLTQVTLQLKWDHQFQFAGFYAAAHRGFYEQEGLVVRFRTGPPGVHTVTEVVKGQAQFGVTDPNVMLDYFRGVPVVVLGAIFQHSPDIIMTRADSGISSPRDLRGKRVMITDSMGSAIWAMLASQDITEYDLKMQQLTWSIDELSTGQTDAQACYLTCEPYLMKKRGIPVNIMRPDAFGINFYGDCLITSARLAREKPELVEAFTRATFKGWEYAMAHTEELIDIIIAKYNPDKPRDELRAEAEAIRELVLPRLIPIGTMNAKRWQHIASVFKNLGMTAQVKPLDDFIYVPQAKRHLLALGHWVPYLGALAVLTIMLLLGLLLFNRKLKKGILERTRELDCNRVSLRQVLDLVPNMVYAKNGEGRFLLANRAMADSLGTTVENIIGQRHLDLHPHRREARRIQDDDQAVLEMNLPRVALEEPHTHADGTLHWYQTTRLPYVSTETGEPAVLVLSVDVTNRRRVNAAIKESEARFKAIFNQAYQFTFITDLDGTVTQTNQTSLDFFHIKESDVVGKKLWDAPWWKSTDVSREWIWELVERAASGEIIQSELASTDPVEGTRHFVFSIKPARDAEGTIIFLIPEAYDVTSLKQTEAKLRSLNEELENRVAERTSNLETAKAELEASLEKLRETQKELVMSEKLAALGSLVAGVAHEINTPLGIGVTAASFLDEKMARLEGLYENDDLKRSDLEKFIHAGRESTNNILINLNRAAELIRSFKQVAADQSSEMARSFNLKTYVDEVLLSLRPKFKHTGHTITNDCPDIELFSYPGAFMQIISNLLLNSLIHAYDEGETGTILIGGDTREDTLELTFSDDGKGIAPELGDTIFEPFSTTKRNQGGTGLGLHIVFNSVTQTLGGAIRFESAPNQGTRYIITMPLPLKKTEQP